MRPWGLINKVLARTSINQWDFVGAVSFEDRCIASYELSKKSQSNIASTFLLRVDDSPSRYTSLINDKTNRNVTEFINRGANERDILRLNLFSPIGTLFDNYKNFVENSTGNVLLDMSCLPKRMLFPILRMTMESGNINNVIVSYSVPEKYTQEQLAEDPQPITTFPGMGGSDIEGKEPEIIIVGLGYLQFDLAELKQQLSGNVPVRVLFPFPPGAPAYQRNWKLLLSLYGEEDRVPEPIRIDARDPSYAYDVLQDLTENGKLRAYILPFGPKPHSLAMALHSIKSGSEMMYTQPKVYHPDYSIGIKQIRGEHEVYGYCIRLNGTDIYS
jgi:hypothetical protein